jgi:hypothetical protein
MLYDDPQLQALINALESQMDQIRVTFPEAHAAHVVYAFIYIGAQLGFRTCSNGSGPVMSCAWHALCTAQAAAEKKADRFLILPTDEECIDA